MITNVTSKVDLPATVSRSRQADAPAKTEHVVDNISGSDDVFVSRASIEHAVGKVREILQQSNSHFQIEVDSDLQRVIVKILNGDSGEVIRQIPPQAVIELAKDLSSKKGLLFEEHV
jgi:flagellar protein FlaG